MLSRLLLEAYPETRVIGEELVSREPARWTRCWAKHRSG